MSAPCSRQMSLNDWSVTSSMGASITGRLPKSMLPIFIVCQCDWLFYTAKLQLFLKTIASGKKYYAAIAVELRF